MMKQLTDYQRSFASCRIMFHEFLSPEVAECLRRATLAGSENGKPLTDVIDLVCGLYLGDQEEVARHLQGDWGAVLKQNFPKHRFGDQGLIPESASQETAAGKVSGGVFFSVKYGDELMRLLWSASTLANAIGKKASIQDVIAAVMQHEGWREELLQYGLTPVHQIANFKTDVEGVVFCTWAFMQERWPPPIEFEIGNAVQVPFRLEAVTPFGRFGPMRLTRVQLNGIQVAELTWPDRPTAHAEVELLKSNKIQLEVEGGTFGSVEVVVRGKVG